MDCQNRNNAKQCVHTTQHNYQELGILVKQQKQSWTGLNGTRKQTTNELRFFIGLYRTNVIVIYN